MPTTSELELVQGELSRISAAWSEQQASYGLLEGRMAASDLVVAHLTATLEGYQARDAERSLPPVDVIQAGPYEGLRRSELQMLRSLALAMDDAPMLARLEAAITATNWNKALADNVASELWSGVNLASRVAGLWPSIRQPSNPWVLPVDDDPINFYPGSQNTAVTQTDLTPGASTVTARELVGEVGWSYDVDEDSAVAMMPTVRALLEREAAKNLDDAILNADTTTTSSNINYGGTTVAASTAGRAQWLIGFDGLRHRFLVNETSMRYTVSQTDAKDYVTELRKLMGVKAVDPMQLAVITDAAGYFSLMGSDGVETLDTFGPSATILTGQLASVYGIPVIVSQVMRRGTSQGLVSSTASNNVKSTIILVDRSGFRRTHARALTLETTRDSQKRSYAITASMRVGWAMRNSVTPLSVAGATNVS